MVTKHTRQHWPFEPQVLDDDEAEAAYIRSLGEEAEPEPAKPLEWFIYFLIVLCWVVVGWHFVASYLQGATL